MLEAAIGGVLWKKVFLKFRNIHKKTPVLEPLFNKFTSIQPCNFVKKSSNKVFKFKYNHVKFQPVKIATVFINL